MHCGIVGQDTLGNKVSNFRNTQTGLWTIFLVIKVGCLDFRVSLSDGSTAYLFYPWELTIVASITRMISNFSSILESEKFK